MSTPDLNQPALALPLDRLPGLLPPTLATPVTGSTKPLKSWSMEEDDAAIFRYIYRAVQPGRHLEFGTWQGFGVCLCLENSPATVWTINLPEGEAKPDGSWAYGERVKPDASIPPGAVSANYGRDEKGPCTYLRTDAASYIGRLYREKQLGHRVCQIYCDSRHWDTSAYPAGFFDSVLVDGGHSPEIVVNDTLKALPLLRPGGIIMWHDFCPLPDIRQQSEAVAGVTQGIGQLHSILQAQLTALHWINPSYILLGIKK